MARNKCRQISKITQPVVKIRIFFLSQGERCMFHLCDKWDKDVIYLGRCQDSGLLIIGGKDDNRNLSLASKYQ